MVEFKGSVLRVFDPWRSPLCTCPFKYSLHPYTGCSHFCLYCYAASYIGRKPSTPKKEFIERLRRDLKRVKPGSIIEMSTSSDPYPPIEASLMLTRRTVELLGEHGSRILVTTKSNLVVRDADLLAKYPSSVMITITTLDEDLARLIEPGAPPPSVRLEAVRILREKGVPVGVRVDPVIPYVNSDPEELRRLVKTVRDAGALQVTTSSFKARWDSLSRLTSALPEDTALKLRRLYTERGERIHGYMYLPEELRRTLLEPVISEAIRSGLYIATCREGIGILKAPSCDGSGLIMFHPAVQHHYK